MANPSVLHQALGTTFTGVEHPVSTPKLCIHHFRGIKYATIPDRFRQSRLFTSFAPYTDATKYGYDSSQVSLSPIRVFILGPISPVCPQLRQSTFESDLLDQHDDNLPSQVLKQNEFDCLNLNIMRPAGYDRRSRLPVMVWFHGWVYFLLQHN
jgi:carboxylesterase type B